MTVTELVDEMRRLSTLLDDGLAYMRKAAVEHAEAEADYRQAYARAFLAADASTVRARELLADAETDEARRRAYLARGLEKAAVEAVRSRRTQISALQTIAGAHRAEAEFDRTAP